ncbi:TadE/TadG family type IV pilus assembly protein [Qipengyuania flava]|uniref:TadE/TadG family type IV pilus assembly protein n=1 Tax=Qipengyuania flava TaxID=192812 RepID=UPI001C62FD0D|nr:pilus assembly protein TadG-related protein [Qipengyuania flava]QYJ06106.1 Tad domain-containing protein [Qipengyuania flava]
MLTKRICNLFGNLKSDTNGNAMILMALGMPVLIGSSGMAVDMTQWYMWKRELQYAVDQGAIAGAWARAETATQATYQTRADQEFSANLGALSGKTTSPVVALADYNGGTQNSVTVTSTVTVNLPFSQVVISKPTTITANAQATFEAATNWTTCLLALDTSASGALTIGGTASGTVTCGAGTLSTSSTAIVKNGNPSVTLGDIIAAGGIESGLAGNGTIREYINNLSNPYDGLTPPQSTSPQTYGCVTTTQTVQTPNGSTTTTANVVQTDDVAYTYWQGKNQNNAKTQVSYSGAAADTSQDTDLGSQTVANDASEGETRVISETSEWTGRNWPVSGSKNQEIYEMKTTTISYTYTGVSQSGGYDTEVVETTSATLNPGTYNNVTISCDTFFNPGVYTITGVLDFGQNHTVTGDDVMLVLSGSGSERFKLNAQSVVRMSGISESRLINTYSVAAEDAARMAGMLIFDPNSTADVKINGGADMQLEGILYMPGRKAKFNGNSSVSGQCMMLAAGQLEFTGTNDLDSFCVPTGATSFDIGGNTISIRLVT